MLAPLIVLGVLSVTGGWIGTPWANSFEQFLAPSLPPVHGLAAHGGIPHSVGLVIGALVAVCAMASGVALYRRSAQAELLSGDQRARLPVYRAADNLWYVDRLAGVVFVRFGGRAASFVSTWLDRRVVDGLVNAVAVIVGFTAEIARGAQSGYVSLYVKTMLAGIVVALVYVLLTAGPR
jgi:NADH:ubiquinone oxidoreductase subunit 5 (subunit L)/multisubunit Na+/H+ antiporter MnhA subunit